MALITIESKRLYQQVAEQIAHLIEEGQWKPGERLPSERELARELGISRPSVREAMIALELMKLVEVRTGAGIFVVDPPHSNATLKGIVTGDPGPSAFELLDARRVIEGETAAIAAESRTKKDLDKLEAANAKMEEDVKTGRQSVTNREDGDLLFHRAIAAVSRNTVLISIIDRLWADMRSPLFKGIAHSVRLPENALRAVQDHRLIYEQIKNKSAVGARIMMQKHLDQVRRVLLQAK